jgi:hypothetical protein
MAILFAIKEVIENVDTARDQAKGNGGENHANPQLGLVPGVRKQKADKHEAIFDPVQRSKQTP